MKNEYPRDVNDIIEYTRLRKKYPEKDREARQMFGFGAAITKRQMYILLDFLGRLDGKSQSKTCEMCGKIHESDSSMCPDCKRNPKTKVWREK
jgi:rubrerythrin